MKTAPHGDLRLVLGFSPGSLSDHIARIIKAPLSAELGRPVHIELRPGENGVRAAREVAAAEPDGNTLFLATLGTHALAPSLAGKAPYDPLADFACVTLITKSPLLLACHPAVGARSVSELIDHAKSCDPALTYATSAIGGAPHLAAELFQAMTGIAMRHVRYDETERLYSDLEAGAVALSFNNLISMLPRCRLGALRALAVSSVERSAIAPDIPTIAECGVPGYEVTNWVGVVAPWATPANCIDELSCAVTAVVQSDTVKAALARAGAMSYGGAPQEFATFMAAEVERWRPVVERFRHADEAGLRRGADGASVVEISRSRA